MRKQTRLLLVLVVGLAGAGLAVAGVLPQGFVSVTDVAQAPHRFAGHEVHVKAIVAEGSIERGDGSLARFAITDTESRLPVEYRGSLPEMFSGGRTVVVSGILEVDPSGRAVLVAQEIQGGCASKYEPQAHDGAAYGAGDAGTPGAAGPEGSQGGEA